MQTRLIASMLAARSWLESPTTINVVTALGTMLAGVGAIWVIIIAGPRYRLRYGPLTSRQLPDGSWKVYIHLSSRGRRDITRDALDEGKPVLFDIGTGIQRLDEVWSSRETARSVNARPLANCLLIGPALIGRRQDLRFTVLTKAKPTYLTCQASLIDVSVRRQFLTPRWRRRFALLIILVLLIVAVAVATAVLSSLAVQVQPVILVVTCFIVGVALGYWTSGRFEYPDD